MRNAVQNCYISIENLKSQKSIRLCDLRKDTLSAAAKEYSGVVRGKYKKK